MNVLAKYRSVPAPILSPPTCRMMIEDICYFSLPENLIYWALALHFLIIFQSNESRCSFGLRIDNVNFYGSVVWCALQHKTQGSYIENIYCHGIIPKKPSTVV